MSLQLIDNLNRYLERNPGEHVICSGTYDPVTLGHMRQIGIGLQEASITKNPLVIIAHNRTIGKNPVHLKLRYNMLIASIIRVFGAGVRALLCTDLQVANKENRDKWNIIKRKYIERILFIFGDDKNPYAEGRSIIIPRKLGISSSKVRAVLASNSLSDLNDMVTEDVRNIIDKNRHLYINND